MSLIQVLFIEDEKQLRQYASSLLTQRGLKVFAAANTAEADQIMRREKIDVIICDILMQAEDGLSYISRLRAEGTYTPVILLSALADEKVIKLGIDSGAADYLVKPFDTEQLIRRIITLAKREGGTPEG